MSDVIMVVGWIATVVLVAVILRVAFGWVLWKIGASK